MAQVEVSAIEDDWRVDLAAREILKGFAGKLNGKKWAASGTAKQKHEQIMEAVNHSPVSRLINYDLGMFFERN